MPTILYYADDQRQLVSIALDASAGTVSGSANVVANEVGFQPSTYWSAFAVAQNGTLIYNSSVGSTQSALTWMDRSGKELGHIGDPAILANPMLSPDGSRVALDISDQKANNVDRIEARPEPATRGSRSTRRKRVPVYGRETEAWWPTVGRGRAE
jgi:hypothetical protein